MNSQLQEKVQAFCFLNAAASSRYMKAYATSAAVEEASRYIPFVGSIIAGSISFASTYSFLRESLNQLEKTALDFLEDCNERVGKDIMKMEFQSHSSESAINNEIIEIIEIITLVIILVILSSNSTATNTTLQNVNWN